MCGRFFIKDQLHTDFSPGDKCRVIIFQNGILAPILCLWGFPHPSGSGLIFNARSETAAEKTLFRDSLERRRCVIPASGFYEWDQSRNKYMFTAAGANVPFYFAGFYNIINNELCFVILTTEPSEEIAAIHDRMPLILTENELDIWLNDDHSYNHLMTKKPVHLNCSSDYIQMRLPL